MTSWRPFWSPWLWVLLTILVVQSALGLVVHLMSWTSAFELTNQVGMPHYMTRQVLPLLGLLGMGALIDRVVRPGWVSLAGAVGAAVLVAAVPGVILLLPLTWVWTISDLTPLVGAAVALAASAVLVGVAIRDRTWALLLHAAWLPVVALAPLSSGFVLAGLAHDIYLHDTVFEVGHAHAELAVPLLVLNSAFAVRWRPLASWGAGWLVVIALGMMVAEDFIAGMAGIPRRYPAVAWDQSELIDLVAAGLGVLWLLALIAIGGLRGGTASDPSEEGESSGARPDSPA